MRIVSLLCLLFISLSMSGQKPVEIMLEPSNQKQGPLMLSDLVESVEYIPLETNDKCLIGMAPRTYDISPNYIVLHCMKMNQVYLFRRNGSFVCRVGASGHGPGEYLEYAVSNVFIDEVRKQIQIGTTYPYKMSYYDFKGKYIKSVPLTENASGDKAFFLRNFNNEYLLSYTKTTGTIPYMYELRSPDLKLLKKAVKTLPFKTKDGIYLGFNETMHYLHEGRLHVMEPVMNDTLYRITDKNEFQPKYCINSGKHKVTSALRSDSKAYKQLQKSTGIVHFVQMFETNNFLILYYGFRSQFYYAYYSISTGKLLHFASDKGIPNDYDGGLDFSPCRQDEHVWSAFIEASSFEEELSKPKEMTPKGPKKAVDTFNRLKAKLDNEDNPVLMIVKMKE